MVFKLLRNPADLFLLARIVVFGAAVPLLLRLKLPLLEALLKRKHVSARTDPVKAEKIIIYLGYALRFGHPLVRRGCLVRGFTAYYFLREAGMNVSLCFGMSKVGNDFAGHCWLVKDGKPFLEKSDPYPMFSAIYSIPYSTTRLS